jgi:hypothetical protein
MARALTKCPQCGERASPFAAGCALCGADLDAARRAGRGSGRRGFELPRVPSGGLGSARIDWLHVLIAVLFALALAPVGFFLALYWAWQRNRAGEPVMVALMLGVAVVAATAPLWFWRLVYGV